MLALTESARTTAGVVMLTIVGIEYGGLFLVRTVRSDLGLTDFQRSFFRAGHAHAGVLVILGLVCLPLTGATSLTGFWNWLASTGALIAAILMSAGFFISALGAGRTQPNRFIVVLFAGAAMLAAGVVTLGIGLLVAPA
jgi:phosphoglycerol transferase MdoB-like AlkP superfamily enzyme